MKEIVVIDSHTEGEPTRLVVKGFPELTGTVHQKLESLRQHHDDVRQALCLEPRGNEVAIGAALFEPSEPDCLADLVFFNNKGYLGMCGHGTIGVLATLAYMKRLSPSTVTLNTVAGPVKATLHDASSVTVQNVPSYRWKKDVSVEVPHLGTVVGDIAYGGNWFFLVKSPQLAVSFQNLEALTAFTTTLMKACERQGVTGKAGAVIDHIEVFGPPDRHDAQSKNYVLCPGGQYDRSPCGTGTSAKLACLYEDGVIKPGDIWRQESIIGSLFEGSVEVVQGQVIPSIRGTAFVTAETKVVIDPQDPFAHGIVS